MKKCIFCGYESESSKAFRMWDDRWMCSSGTACMRRRKEAEAQWGVLVETDARGRISLAKVGIERNARYLVTQDVNGAIVLKPAVVTTKEGM